MSAMRGYEALFQRHARNPILTAADWPYPAHTVFNAGRHAAARRHDAAALPGRGSPRALAPLRGALGERRRRLGHRRGADAAARSRDASRRSSGASRIRASPSWRSSASTSIAYTAFSKGGPGVALALTEDFRTLRALRAGHAARRQGRGAAAAAHRRQLRAHPPPDDRLGRAHLDLVLAGPAQLGQPQADAAGAQGRLVGREQGRALAAADRDRARLADALPRRPAHRGRQPLPARRSRSSRWTSRTVCLLRGDAWIFGPEASYEREGDVGNVAFPCGYTLGADGDTINLYYGAADTLHRARDRAASAVPRAGSTSTARPGDSLSRGASFTRRASVAPAP